MPSPPPTSTPPVASTPPSTNSNSPPIPSPPNSSSPPPPLPPVANVSSPPSTNVIPSPPPLSPPPQSSNPPPPPPPPPPSSSSSASPPPPSRSSPPAKHSIPTTSPPPPPSSTTPSPPPPKPPTPPVPAPRPPQNPPPQPNPPRNSPPPPLPSPPPATSNTPLPRNPPPSPSPPPPNTNAPPVPSTSLPAPTPSSDSPPGSSPPPIDVTSPPPPSFLSPPSLSPPLPSLVPPGSSSTNNSGNNASRNSQPSSAGGIGTAGTVAVTSVGLLFFGVLGIVAWCLWKRKKKVFRRKGVYVVPASIGSSPNSDSGLLKVQTPLPSNGSGLGSSRALFAYDELVKATNRFSAQNILGEGGFGCVYKGNLADGRVVAVKQLKIGGGQGEREFRSEVEIISRIHHRHLVSLVGFCISEERRLLLYDFIPNNTLYFHLHGEGRPVMDWTTRVKIANGAARGIAYLHEDCHPRIIHRDIKSSNILLDNNFEARVSDFGLAKLADADTHVTTHVMGTFGYMAPEYACCGKLTEKSDVYSFGVVLLELVTGRKPVDTSQPAGEESLVEWARPLLSNILETEEFRGLADPRLEGQYVDSEMFRMIEAAAGCVRHSSTMRPKMSQILRAFDSMVTSDLTNGMKVGESEMFDPAKQSEEIRLFQRMAFGCQDYTIDFLSENSWCSEGNHVNSPGDRSAEFPKEFSN